MNVFQHLKTEHEELRSLLNELGETTTRAAKTRAEGLDKVRHDLAQHMAYEEEVFYPELIKQAKLREYVLEGYEEHNVARFALRGLDDVPTDDERWSIRIKVLKELLEHHIEEEEGEMFPAAREALDEDTIQALGDQVALKAEEFQATWRAGQQGNSGRTSKQRR